MPGDPIYPDLRDADAYERSLLRSFMRPVYDAIETGLRASQGGSVDDLKRQLEGGAFQPQLGEDVPQAQIEAALGRMQRRHDSETRRTFANALGVDVSAIIRDRGEVEAHLRRAIDRNVGLIKTIPEDLHGDLRRRLESMVFDDARFVDEQRTAELVAAVSRFGGYRLRRIVRDQNSKMTGQLTEIRHRQAGITHYRWSTSRDERVRPTHVVKEGRMFAWAKPPADTGHPGDDIMCRCAAAPIITEPLKRKADEEVQDEGLLPSQEELARYGYVLESDPAYRAPPSDYAAMREFLQDGYAQALNETPLVTEGYVSAGDLRQTFDLADETWTNADLDVLADQRPWFSVMFRGVVAVQSTTTTLNAWVALRDFGRTMDLGVWDAFRLVMTALAGTQVISPMTARIGDLLVRVGRRYSEVIGTWEAEAKRRAKVRVEISDFNRSEEVPVLRPQTPPPAVEAVRIGYTEYERTEWIQTRIEEVRDINTQLDEDQLYIAVAHEFDKHFGVRGKWLGTPEYRGEPRILFIRRRAKEWMDEFGALTEEEATRRATIEYDQGRWTGWLPMGALDPLTRPPTYPKRGQTKSGWLDTRMRQLRQDNPGLSAREALRYAAAEYEMKLWRTYDPFVAAGKRISRLDTPRPAGRRGRKEWVRDHARLMRLHDPNLSIRESYVFAQVEWVRSEFPPPDARPIAGRTRDAWIRQRATQLRNFDTERYGSGYARARAEWDALDQPGLTVPPVVEPDIGSFIDVSQAYAAGKWQTRILERYRLELRFEMTIVEVIDYAKRWWAHHGVGDIPELTFANVVGGHHGIAEEIGGREIVMYLRTGAAAHRDIDEFRMTKGVLVQKLTSVLMERLYTNQRATLQDAPGPRSKEFLTLLARMYESDVVDDASDIWLKADGVDFDAAVDTLDWARRVARSKAMNEYQSEIAAHLDGTVRFTGRVAEDYADDVGAAPDGVRFANLDVDDAPSFARSRPAGDVPIDLEPELRRRTTAPPPPNKETPSPDDYLDLLKRRARYTGEFDDAEAHLVLTSKNRFDAGGWRKRPHEYIEDRVAVLMEYNETHGYTLRDAQDQATREFADLFSEPLVDEWSSEAYKLLTPATPPAPTYTAVVDGAVVELSGQALVLEIAGRVQEISGSNPLLSLRAARKLAVREFNTIRGNTAAPHMTQAGGAVLEIRMRNVVEMLPYGDDLSAVAWIERQAVLLMDADPSLVRSEALRKADAHFDWLVKRGDIADRPQSEVPRAVFADSETGSAATEAEFNRMTELLASLGLIDNRALFRNDVKRLTRREWMESSIKRPPQVRVRPKLDIEFATGVLGVHDDDVIHLLYTARDAEPQTTMVVFLHELGHALHHRYLLATDEVPSGATSHLGEIGRTASRRMNHSPTYRGIMLRLLEKHAGLRLKTRPASGGRRELLLDLDVDAMRAAGASDADIEFLTTLATPDFDLADIRRNAMRRGMLPDTLLAGVADEPAVLVELPPEEMARLYGAAGDLADRGLFPDSVLGVDTHGRGARAALALDLDGVRRLEFRLPTNAFKESDYVYVRFEEGRPPVRIPRADAKMSLRGKWTQRTPETLEQLYEVLHDWVNRQRLLNGIDAPYEVLLRRAAMEYQTLAVQHIHAKIGSRSGKVPLNPIMPPMVLVADLADDSAHLTRNLDAFNEFRLLMMAERYEDYNPWYSSVGTGRKFARELMEDADKGVVEGIPVAPLSIRPGESFADFLTRRTKELKPSFQFETEDSLKLWATLEWKSVDGVDMTGVPRTPFDNPSNVDPKSQREALYAWESRTLDNRLEGEGAMIAMDIEETEAFVRKVWSAVDIGEDIEVVWWTKRDPDWGFLDEGKVGMWSGNRLYLYPDTKHTTDLSDPKTWRATQLTVLHELSHALHERLQVMSAANMRPGVFDKTPFMRALDNLTGHDATMVGIELRMLDEFHEGLNYDDLVESIVAFNKGRRRGKKLQIDFSVDSTQWARRQARLLGFTDEQLETARNRRPRRVTTRVFEPSAEEPRMPPPLRARVVEGDSLDDLRSKVGWDLGDDDAWTDHINPAWEWEREIDESWELVLEENEYDRWEIPDFDPVNDSAVKWAERFADDLFDNYAGLLTTHSRGHARGLAVLAFGRYHSHKVDMNTYGDLFQRTLTKEYGGLPFEYRHYDEGSPEFFMALSGANRLAAVRFTQSMDVEEWLGNISRWTDEDVQNMVLERMALPNMPSLSQMGLEDFDPDAEDWSHAIDRVRKLLVELNPNQYVSGSTARAQIIAKIMFAQLVAERVPTDHLRRSARLTRPIPDDAVESEWIELTTRNLQDLHLWREQDAERVAKHIWDNRRRGFDGTRREAIDEIYTDASTQNMLYGVQSAMDERSGLSVDDQYLTISEAKAYIEMVWRAFGINEAVELHIQKATAKNIEEGLKGYTQAGVNWIRIIDDGEVPDGLSDAKLALGAQEGGVYLSKSTVLHEMTHLLVHRGLMGRENNPLGVIPDEAYSVLEESYHNHAEVFATLLAHMRKEFYDGMDADEFMRIARQESTRIRREWHDEQVRLQRDYMDPDEFDYLEAQGHFEFDDERAKEFFGEIRFAPDVVRSARWARENAMLGGMTEQTVKAGADKRVVSKFVDPDPSGWSYDDAGRRMENRTSYAPDAGVARSRNVRRMHAALTDPDDDDLPPADFRWRADGGETPQEWVDRYAALFAKVEPDYADDAVETANYWWGYWFGSRDDITPEMLRGWLADDTPVPFDPTNWRSKAFTKWPDGDTSRWQQAWVDGHVVPLVQKNGWLDGQLARRLLRDDYRLGTTGEQASPYGRWRTWRSAPIRADTDPIKWIDDEGARLSSLYLPSLTESEGKALAAMHWWRRHDTASDVYDLDYMYATDRSIRYNRRDGGLGGDSDHQRRGAYRRERLAYELWLAVTTGEAIPGADDYNMRFLKKHQFAVDSIRKRYNITPGEPLPEGMRLGTEPMTPKDATYYAMRWWAARSGIRKPPSIAFRLLHEGDERGLLGVAMGGDHIAFIVDPKTGMVVETVVNHELAHAAGYKGVNRGMGSFSHDDHFSPAHGKVFTGLIASNAMAETGMPDLVWGYAYYADEMQGFDERFAIDWLRGAFENPHWTRHKALHDLMVEGGPRPHATIDLFEGVNDRPEVLIDEELRGILTDDDVPDWADWSFVEGGDLRWILEEDTYGDLRSALTAVEDGWTPTRTGEGQAHYAGEIGLDAEYWPRFYREFRKSNIKTAWTGVEYTDYLPPSISRLPDEEAATRAEFVPGGRLVDWHMRRNDAGRITTTQATYSEDYQQLYQPTWLMRLRSNVDDLDDVAPPSVEDVRTQFDPDFVVGATDRPVVNSVEEARDADGSLVFDELRLPAGVFVKQDSLQTVRVPAVDSDGVAAHTGVDMAPMHEVKLVAEYEDVWISRRTGKPETDLVPTETMTDAEIKEKFPHMFKVDRYRVWSVDRQLDPMTALDGTPGRNVDELPPLPREVQYGATLEDEVQDRALVLAFHYKVWDKRMSPDYKPTDEADARLTEAVQAEYRELVEHARREYELIDEGFVTGNGYDSVLGVDDSTEWPDDMPGPRLSTLFDGSNRRNAIDGFPASSTSMPQWMQTITNWEAHHGITPNDPGALDTHSKRYYAVLDAFDDVHTRTQRLGYNRKSRRSPEHSPDMDLPLKDAGYDRGKIRKHHHVLGVQREFVELDKLSDYPVDWGKYIIEASEDAADQGELFVFGLHLDEDKKMPYVLLRNPEWRDEFGRMTQREKVAYMYEQGDDEYHPIPEQHIVFYPFDEEGNLTPLTPEIEEAIEATHQATVRELKKRLENGSDKVWAKAEVHRDGSHIDYDTGMAQDRLGTSAGMYVGSSWEEREQVRTGTISPDDYEGEGVLRFATDMLEFGSSTGKDFKAWRGLRLLDGEVNQMGYDGVIDGLTSTSLDLPQAEGFANQHGTIKSAMRGNSVLQFFHVPKGSHGVFIGAGETEFVLPQGTRVELIYEEQDVLIIDSTLDDPMMRPLGFDYVQYYRVVPEELAGGDNQKMAIRTAPREPVDDIGERYVDEWTAGEYAELDEDTSFWVAVPAKDRPGVEGGEHPLRPSLTPFIKVDHRGTTQPWMLMYRNPDDAMAEAEGSNRIWDIVEIVVEAGSLISAEGDGSYVSGEYGDDEFDVIPLAVYWGSQIPQALQGRGFRRYYIARGARHSHTELN